MAERARFGSASLTINFSSHQLCGEGEIRTREGLASLTVFKTVALVHYATSPLPSIIYEIALNCTLLGLDEAREEVADEGS